MATSLTAHQPPTDPALAPADLQLDWDTSGVRAGWVHRLDDHYMMDRLLALTSSVALRGKPRRALDVAAAEGLKTAELALAGVEARYGAAAGG